MPFPSSSSGISGDACYLVPVDTANLHNAFKVVMCTPYPVASTNIRQASLPASPLSGNSDDPSAHTEYMSNQHIRPKTPPPGPSPPPNGPRRAFNNNVLHLYPLLPFTELPEPGQPEGPITPETGTGETKGPGPSKRAETEVPVYTQSPNDPNTEKRILKAVNEILLVIQASRTKVDDPTNPFNDPGADFIPEPTKPQIPFRQVDGDLLKGKKPGTRAGQPTYPPPAPLPDREPKRNTRPRPQR
ncbi:hypothetical protein V8E51_018095 [Hyaloscypha variabilis]